LRNPDGPPARCDERSAKLIGAALAGLASIWRDGYRYKKAGVVLLNLHPAAAVKEGLFDKADNPRRVALMRTVDRLNLRFGRVTVSFARRRLPAAVETAPGVSVALLHDGVGGLVEGLGASGRSPTKRLWIDQAASPSSWKTPCMATRMAW
jgi:hypothetical protein